MFNTKGKSTGFETNSQFQLSMRKSDSCMLGGIHLSNGKHVFHFQIHIVNNMSIKRGRNIAVVKGSVVNALESEIPRLSLPDTLNELRTEIWGCIIAQLSSNAFV